MSAAHKTMMHKSFKSGFGISARWLADTELGAGTQRWGLIGVGDTRGGVHVRGNMGMGRQALKYCEMDAIQDPYKPPAASQRDIIATSLRVHVADMIWDLRRLKGSVVFVVPQTICFNPLCGAASQMLANSVYLPFVMVIGKAAENGHQILTLSG